MVRSVVSFVILFFSFLGAAAQQDAQYSQYIFNAIYINPAYAGYRERLNANATYRNQWIGIEGSPESYSFAVDGLLANEKVGLSIIASGDKLGAQNNLSIYGNYAYRMPVGYDETSKLSFGLGLGFQQNGIDGAKFYAIDTGDDYIPTGMVKTITPDISIGAFYNTEKMYIGASAKNLVSKYISDKKSEDYNYAKARPHFYVTGGMLVPIVDYEVEFKPFFLVKDEIGSPTVLDINALFLFKQKLWIGGGYRTGIKTYNKPAVKGNVKSSNAIIGMAEFFVEERFRFGYSFDYSMSALSGYSGGTHEISISMSFSTKSERRGNFCYF